MSSTVPSSLCLVCKAGRMLCGKLYCPIIARAKALVKRVDVLRLDKVEGSTPPGVFVGRVGYPKVSVGPLVPPYHGDTSMLDTPETWVGKSLEEILDFRFSLIRGKTMLKVDEPQQGGKLLELLQETAMSSKPVDVEVSFSRRPSRPFNLSEDYQPFGPSAPLKSLSTSGVHVDRRIEKCYYDHDLRANEAIAALYGRGVPVSKVQRSLSLGMLGKRDRRRLVPTRWSITAVDSLLSLHLLEGVKQLDTVSEYRVYTLKNLDNIFVAVLIPGCWGFEWIEAWFPGTVWNRMGENPEIMGDYEGFKGRKTYATVGGCYYAARLAVAEALGLERRQACVLVLREIHGGYVLPVGVWNVRESVRHALRTKPETFFTLQDTLNYAASKLTIPLKKWLQSSVLLKNLLLQKRLTDFIWVG